MPKLGIPVFQERVSPVFDTSTRLLMITYNENREIERREIFLDGFSLTERVSILRQSGITVLICGGITDTLYHMLKSAKIRLITGIAGSADQVLDAFLSDQLQKPPFLMPGYKT
jgi:predicted Fe-Mo cluster-binding NifX family protein